MKSRSLVIAAASFAAVSDYQIAKCDLHYGTSGVHISHARNAGRKGMETVTASAMGIAVSAPYESAAVCQLKDRLKHERRKLYR